MEEPILPSARLSYFNLPSSSFLQEKAKNIYWHAQQSASTTDHGLLTFTRNWMTTKAHVNPKWPKLQKISYFQKVILPQWTQHVELTAIMRMIFFFGILSWNTKKTKEWENFSMVFTRLFFFSQGLFRMIVLFKNNWYSSFWSFISYLRGRSRYGGYVVFSNHSLLS